LGEEFVDYQLLRDEDIPAHVWNDARIEPREDDENVHYRMDTLWHYQYSSLEMATRSL